MGITTVISTDSLRGVMRSMAAESSCPLLFASTYQAGDCLPPLPVDPDVESAAVERKRAGACAPVCPCLRFALNRRPFPLQSRATKPRASWLCRI